ncbi:hypothetical protein SAMN05216196_101666 [Lutimaribacter pacificus]|uniref:Flp pilus assembly protein, pilin Flp n=1 Tax=Lutimaribacter pacificus TaxID=391948 RepID=A0A1H0BRF3_9RHOB|nr:hypothetical protein [Lutimaribacter pacificus]SDN48210.1 hypothetical protein SAMN05216196_101666 [Lutimaribacter pacificus]SHJ53015.1 hypothetical protein SAMN05444142_101551 [Lutimaribacter pacificus]
MIKFFKNFRKDEDGAVTVDWVVLTAAVVGLAIVAFGAINENAASLAGATAEEIGTTVPVYTP